MNRDEGISHDRREEAASATRRGGTGLVIAGWVCLGVGLAIAPLVITLPITGLLLLATLIIGILLMIRRRLMAGIAMTLTALVALLLVIGLSIVGYSFFRNRQKAGQALRTDGPLSRSERSLLPLDLSATASGTPATGIPLSKRKTVIGRTEPDLPVQLRAGDLEKMCPAFRHVPFDQSGFSHLTLPFRVAGDPTHAREEARAFAFLLSSALDWVPGNYCARHAYFVFKRAREEMIQLEQAYDPVLIAAQMDRWRASHAIGGTFAKGVKGYTGSLVVYGPRGTMLLQKSYDTPRSFWDLLGDMCVDSSICVGHTPSPALNAHFRKPRCQLEASLRDLGAAAFLEERTGAEFECYRRALERDPGFAEVRYWIANQGYWQHDNRAMYQKEKERCLSDYMTAAVMDDFDLTKENVPVYRQFITQAEALVGPDAPEVARWRLKADLFNKWPTDKDIEQGLTVISRYPIAYPLLSNVRNMVWAEGLGRADADLCISISLAQLGSRYMPGSSESTRWTVNRMTTALGQLGYPLLAASLARQTAESAMGQEDPKSFLDYLRQLAGFLRLSRQFETALQVEALIADVQNRAGIPPEDSDLLRATACAAFAGDPSAVRHQKARIGEQKGSTFWVKRADAYKALVAGRPVSSDLMLWTGGTIGAGYAESLIVMAESDLAAGSLIQRDKVAEYLAAHPNNPEFWILFDAYDRKAPLPESSFFYESLAWLHPESAWVARAVQARRERCPSVPVPDAAVYEAMLHNWSSNDWSPNPTREQTASLPKPIRCGAIVLAARQLVTAGEGDRARRLINQYKNYGMHSRDMHTLPFGGHDLRAHCNHVMHVLKIRDIGKGMVKKPAAAPAVPGSGGGG